MQSVAVRLVVDRENEIRAFVPQEYWSIDAKFTAPPSRKVFAAKLVKVDGKRVDKTEIPDKATADALLERLQNASYSVQNSEKACHQRGTPHRRLSRLPSSRTLPTGWAFSPSVP